MRTLAVCALLALLVVSGLGASAREERGHVPVHVGDVRTDSKGRTFQAVGVLIHTVPRSEGARIELFAAVWVPVKQGKGTWCYDFESERNGDSLSIAAFCKPAKRGGSLMASFEVEVIEWEGNTGEGFDSCRDRHDIKRDSEFSCTVDVPADFK
ncbi:MAG: hypothetical protein U0031_15080 [Thermomicrobiales bacterium]